MTPTANQWIDGLKLGEAWFILADTEMQHQYRNAGRNRQRTEALEVMMRKDLLDRIRDEQLQCAGVCTSPEPSKGPTLVPGFIFFEPQVDWDRSSVAAYNYVYESVRVLRTELLTPSANALPSAPKKMGRPSIQSQLDNVVAELNAEGRANRYFPKRTNQSGQSAGSRGFPQTFPRPSQPSRSKILEALLRAEQKIQPAEQNPKKSKKSINNL